MNILEKIRNNPSLRLCKAVYHENRYHYEIDEVQKLVILYEGNAHNIPNIFPSGLYMSYNLLIIIDSNLDLYQIFKNRTAGINQLINQLEKDNLSADEMLDYLRFQNI